MSRNPRGFTIVELLIVIVIIAILAAITIVAYNGIQNRANDSAVQSDISNSAKRIEMWRTVSAGDTYPTASQLGASDNRLKFSKGSYQTSNNAVLYCQSSDGKSFALIGKSKSGTTYYSRNGSEVAVYSHTFPQSATTACPNAGAGLVGAGWIHDVAVTPNWATWVD